MQAIQAKKILEIFQVVSLSEKFQPLLASYSNDETLKNMKLFPKLIQSMKL